MFSMQLDSANNLVNITSSLFVIGAAVIGLLFWFFKLRTDIRSLERDVERLEKQVDQRTIDQDKRHDGVQTTLNIITAGMGKIDGKLEILLNQMGSNR